MEIQEQVQRKIDDKENIRTETVNKIKCYKMNRRKLSEPNYNSSLVLLLLVLIVSPSVANSPPRFVVEGGNEIVVNKKEGLNTPIGSVIAELRGTDPDGDELSFGLQGEEAKALLSIDSTGPDSAVVTLRTLLDREQRDEYTLVITLTDGKLGENTFITQSLLLLVEDVNDNEPIFLPFESAIQVEENSAPKVLASLRAMDSDEGPYGQVVYALTGDEAGDMDMFSLRTQGGEAVLQLNGLLDYEQKNIYQLKVLAKDRAPGTSSNTGTAAIVVRVGDVEDQPPEFTHAPPVTRIPEDTSVNEGVLQVRAVDGDKGINNKIRYRIVEGAEGFFGLDPDSGVLYVAKPLDRERYDATGETFFIKIVAEEVSSLVSPPPSTMTEVTVLLQDVNDQTPKFRAAHYIAEVSENAQFNMPVNFIGDAIPEIFDSDQGINGTFTLDVVGAGDLFDVTPRGGINLASFLIRVKNPALLDYEKIQVVNFTIVAKESVAVNPKSSSSLVSVFIRDTNDNVPVFEDDTYQSRIMEDTPGGSVLARVKAFDPDSGIYGTDGIRYTDLRGTYANRLVLNPTNGDILLREDQTLDREDVGEFFVTVEARDNNGKGNRNSVSVHIIVEDVNDNAPQFTLSRYQFAIDENRSAFPDPVIIHAKDADLNGTSNHEVRYSIIGGDLLGNFSLNEITGELMPKTALDYEMMRGNATNAFFNLTVKAYDLGVPSLSSLTNVLVYLSDINDHAPEFDRVLYRNTIPEDTPGGTTVLKVHATDSDGSPLLSTVVYRIQSGAVDKFVIDAHTGTIVVARGAILDPDRSVPRTTSYPLEVIALDGGIGSAQLKARTVVNITIIDVNNKPPVFADLNTVRVLESVAPGNFISKVEALDPDEDHLLQYSIDHLKSEARNEEGAVVKTTDHLYTSAFEIGESDGVVRLVKKLDREQTETIRLVVVCEDLKTTVGEASASTTLTVVVEDVNDNAPVFRKPFYHRTVDENSEEGVTIVTVTADDVDKNRTITYSLEGSTNASSLVHMDPFSGEVVVSGRIDREEVEWMNFTVVAVDSGVPPRSASVDLFIQVLDENDNNPEFAPHPPTLTVREDAPVGTALASLTASDRDTGAYAQVTYLLDRRSAKGKFGIDPVSGELSLLAPLDRELSDHYTLIVEAWDNYEYGHVTGESRNVFTQIDISVTDINDEVPVFEKREGCTLITEFHEKGDTVTVVQARDGDDPLTPNGRIKFTIEQGNEQGLFEMRDSDGSSADIISTSSLVGLHGNYTLQVSAQDQGVPPNKVVTPYTICVTDYNDHAPLFVSPDANVTIKVPENATVGSLVIQVRAIDDDVGPNGAILYRIKKDVSGAHKTFAVDPVTGTITLTEPLDREQRKVYQIRVEAHDQGLPTPLASDLDLTIYVRNINDFLPTFQQKEFSVNFTEHSPPGRETLKLPDTVDHDDMDLEDTVSLVCYYIVMGETRDHFHLDKSTHLLSVTTQLDREVKSTHSLVIKASEDCVSAPPPISTFDATDDTLLSVIVNVNDINDNAPKFIRREFTGGISTESDFGLEVMKLEALDKDSGRNAELHFSLKGKVQATVSEGLEKLRKSLFLVDQKTGVIRLNFDPQRGMKGYFDFEVSVRDSDGLTDTARVFIYLLREDQRVRFVLRQSPDEVRDRIDYLRDYLSNVTGAIVNVDDYKVHENNDGTVDQTKTDLYLHLVNKDDHSVIEAPKVLLSIDQKVQQLHHLFQEMNVLNTSSAKRVAGKDEDDKLLLVWMVGVVAFLALLLVVTLSLCVAQRAHYSRQLRAATATAFGSTDSGLNRVQTVPNTNLHSVEGSNPIWMSGFDNEWYKEEESLRYQHFLQSSDTPDSLDENTVDASLSARTERDAPYMRHSSVTTPGSSDGSTANSSARLTTHPQKSPINGTIPLAPSNGIYGPDTTYKNNLQHTFKKMTNPLLDKKLETTEL